MNFKEIVRMQKELDDKFIKSREIDRHAIAYQTVLALMVELGEFANEYAPFKYWKNNIEIDRELLLEEYVDGIHFLASLAHTVGLDGELVLTPKIVNHDLSKQLLETFKSFTVLIDNLNEQNVVKAFETYLGNAELLDITQVEINEYYLKKNKINHQRIENNY